jgi:hypothetical protein
MYRSTMLQTRTRTKTDLLFSGPITCKQFDSRFYWFIQRNHYLFCHRIVCFTKKSSERSSLPSRMPTFPKSYQLQLGSPFCHLKPKLKGANESTLSDDDISKLTAIVTKTLCFSFLLTILFSSTKRL